MPPDSSLAPADAALLAGYAPQHTAHDELCEPNGAVRPHWAYLVGAVEALGREELGRRFREARRLLRENGVTYNVYDDPQETERTWPLDLIPALLPSDEWQAVEQALAQRAELLDLILADLYGPHTLIRKGLLPPEVVYAHSGFLRPCADVPAAQGRHLPVYAADLARTPDGTFRVLGDRAQAPSGAGYALENRVILSRVLPSIFRDSHVHRLPLFFRRWRTMLASLAPPGDETPHIVLLTPGSGNEAFFEHAFLASYLGCTLAQGEDLTVRDQRVWLRTLEGLRAVDVILRRVDDAYSDPLELRPDSLLGTPGLLQAARQRRVAIVNPLGSSVVENPALMPYLPRLARELLGEELKLDSVETWWCGDDGARAYVLENLDRLVVKPIHPHASGATAFGGMLDAAGRARLADEIRAAPHLYVGQEHVPLSTAPVLSGDRLEPRAMVLRSFLVADATGYAVMPGGLCRVAPGSETEIVSNQRGGVSKDVWVLASEPVRESSVLLAADRPLHVERGGEDVPGRVADNLFWVGRYAARAEASARVLREVLQRMLDVEAGPADPTLPPLLRVVTHATGTFPGFIGPGAAERLASPDGELRSVLLEARRSGGMRFNLDALTRAARAVRDRFSPDAWRVIGALHRDPPAGHDLQEAYDHLDRVLLLLAAFGGLSADSISRGQRWRFLEIGRRTERGLGVIALVRAFCPPNGEPSGVPWEALLSIADASITYRRRYRSGADPGAILDLLIDDETNPRSLVYQLFQLDVLLDGLAGSGAPQRVEEQTLVRDAIADLRRTAALGSAQNSVRRLDVELDAVLEGVRTRLLTLSEQLARAYFSRGAGAQQLVRIV